MQEDGGDSFGWKIAKQERRGQENYWQEYLLLRSLGMPIEVDRELVTPSETVVKRVAYEVVGQAFKLHSEYGTLFSENVYKHELAERCRRGKLGVIDTEFRVVVRHLSFRKEYFVDLLTAEGVPFELKAQTGVVEAHRAQMLNYLFLLGLQRGKLINFGAASLEHEFVSTSLDHVARRQFEIDDERWEPQGEICREFKRLVEGVLADWGAWLSVSLYQEAMVHLLGGAEKVVRDVVVASLSNRPLQQRAHTLSERIAFKITALRNPPETYAGHLRLWLNQTGMDAIQWLNMNGDKIQFITIEKRES